MGVFANKRQKVSSETVTLGSELDSERIVKTGEVSLAMLSTFFVTATGYIWPGYS